ncbi:MAG: hypothetical protein HY304_06525 [candidate division Zixibacteria bacterium]|nr:hypothetical protein [candidate division Zixibacteria bacterium]
MITENYLDPDVGYLLGLIVARGQISSGTGSPIISIDFPHRSLEAKGIKKTFDQEHYVEHNLLLIKERISATLGHIVEHKMQSGRGTIIIRFPGRPMTFRNIEFLLGEGFTPKKGRIPRAVFDAPAEIQRQFMRGFADCAGFVRPSNAYMGRWHRVYFQIANDNWILPIEVCALLQTKLKVPVQSIQWGHPNIRTPHDPTTRSWSKEHQLRVFAHDFLSVGFYVTYKDEILRELADANKGCKPTPFCNPNRSIRRISKKPKHLEENSERLPSSLRRHFDAYWQICLKLGCSQCRKVSGQPSELFGDADE